MYIQVDGIPSGWVCSYIKDCDNLNARHTATFKKTSNGNEFEFAAVNKIESDPVWQDRRKYYGWGRWEFALSALWEKIGQQPPALITGASHGDDYSEIVFNSSIWPEGKTARFSGANYFAKDPDHYDWPNRPPEAKLIGTDQDIAIERTAFTGTTAYFIGRTSKGEKGIDLNAGSHKIFRITPQSGGNPKVEVVGSAISKFLNEADSGCSGSCFGVTVYNFVYSKNDRMFYILANPVGNSSDHFNLYRISEDALNTP